MNDWYIIIENNEMGPYAPAILQSLVNDGQLRPEMLVWTEGLGNWVPAADLDFLHFPASPPSLQITSKPQSGNDVLNHFSFILKSILPSGMEIREKVFASSTFWAFLAIGVTPLLIVTVEQLNLQITLFSLYFAILWGALLKVLLLREPKFWVGGICALFFTGILGLIFHNLWMLQFEGFHDFLNEGTMSDHPAIRLVSFMYFAFVEEFTKAIPVLLAAHFLLKKITHKQLIVLGLFSGLGFAAFENINYSWNSVGNTLSAGNDYGQEGIIIAMVSSLISQMLRSVSLCFLHAIWTGISAYFILMGFMARKNQWLYAVSGVACAGLLHSLYNWLLGIQGTMAGVMALISLLLFFTYTLRFFENENLKGSNI